jgi:hypothetical protein
MDGKKYFERRVVAFGEPVRYGEVLLKSNKAITTDAGF